MSPRFLRYSSYAAQFCTRYFVLYFVRHLAFRPGGHQHSSSRIGHRGAGSPAYSGDVKRSRAPTPRTAAPVPRARPTARPVPFPVMLDAGGVVISRLSRLLVGPDYPRSARAGLRPEYLTGGPLAGRTYRALMCTGTPKSHPNSTNSLAFAPPQLRRPPKTP
jgi:hypothetical protein